MKKFIGVLVAALMIFQTAVFAAPVYVDGDLQGRVGDDEYVSDWVDAKVGDEVDYLATLDMSNAREAYKSYYDRAYNNFSLLGMADAIEAATVTGSFEVKVEFAEGMEIPQAFLEAGKLVGFSANTQGIFTEESRTVENNVVTIVISTSVNAKELYDNIDKYLPDFTLACDGVKVTAGGTYGVFGGVAGATTTTVGEKTLTVEIQSRAAGTQTDEISIAVNVTDDSVVTYQVAVSATSDVQEIVLYNVETEDMVVLVRSGDEFVGAAPAGVYEIVAVTADNTVVDYVASDLGVVVNSDSTATVKTIAAPAEEITYTIETQPNLSYTEGEEIDLSGLVIDVNGEKVAYDDNKDAFTAKLSPDGNTITIIYENVPVKTEALTSYVANEVSAAIVAPVARQAVTKTATAPAGAKYTLGEISWSPAVSSTYAYSTVYTATVTATANDSASFAAAPAAYVNGMAATSVSVSEDGKTATFSYTFPRTGNSGGGGGGGGGGSWGTGATATPAPGTSATPAPSATAAPGSEWFTDVATTDWFYDAVKYVYDAGLMNGTSATTFEPNTNITRGMFVTVLYRLEGQPAVNTGYTFTDVPTDEYYANAVAWGSANGIVTGYSETEYAPDQVILREQIAALMGRYAAYKGMEISGAAQAGYVDADQISEYAVPYVNFCASVGLMSGVGDGYFAPQDNTTRAEVATVIMRVAQSFSSLIGE